MTDYHELLVPPPHAKECVHLMHVGRYRKNVLALVRKRMKTWRSLERKAASALNVSEAVRCANITTVIEEILLEVSKLPTKERRKHGRVSKTIGLPVTDGGEVGG